MESSKQGPRSESTDPEPPEVEKYAGRRETTMDKEVLSEGARVFRLMRRISELGERLTYEQALILAKRYAEIYKLFRVSGVPVEALEVRVKDRKILGAIQNRPDGLRELTCEYKCTDPEDTVLQVWRSADKQFDAVPLLFQELEEVTAKGVSRIEHFPNGQSITLLVIKEQHGVFSVKISFAAGVNIDEGIPRNNSKAASAAGSGSLGSDSGLRASYVAAAAATGVKAKTTYRQTTGGEGFPNLWIQPSGFQVLLKPLLAVSLVLLLGAGSFFGGYVSATKTRDAELGRTSTSTSVGQNPNPAGEYAAMSGAPQGDEASSQDEDASRPVLTQAKANTPVWVGPIATINVFSPPEPLKESALSATAGPDAMLSIECPEQGGVLHAQVIINQNASCDSRLITKPVYVEKLEASNLDENSRQRVHFEITKALERQGFMVVEKDTEQIRAAVVRLRFEAVATDDKKDAAESRNDKGKFPWNDELRNQASTARQHSMTLSDASQRLGMLTAAAIQQAPNTISSQQAGLCTSGE
jgi:hypothetical protein